MTDCIACGPTQRASHERGRALRATFEAHPNYPEQTLLLRSHDGFRDVSRELIARAEEREDGWRAYVELVFRLWHRGMAGHEAYEEHKLYPYLARRFGLSLEVLAHDHERLHGERDAVLEALEEAHRADSAEADDAVLSALRTYHATLDAHLDREEAMVIPPLLAMEPEEFERYTSQPIGRLLDALPACAPA
ncbi:MAG: hemerythrin domain-containing protein [Myxococcota bacterium]